MSPERPLGVPEYPVADPERGDTIPGRHDLAGELIPQNRCPRPGQAGQQRPHDPGPARPVVAIGAVHRGRVDLDQQLMVPGGGLSHLRDLDHFRRPVPGANCCLHSRMLAAHRPPRPAQLAAGRPPGQPAAQTAIRPRTATQRDTHGGRQYAGRGPDRRIRAGGDRGESETGGVNIVLYAYQRLVLYACQRQQKARAPEPGRRFQSFRRGRSRPRLLHVRCRTSDRLPLLSPGHAMAGRVVHGGSAAMVRASWVREITPVFRNTLRRW